MILTSGQGHLGANASLIRFGHRVAPFLKKISIVLTTLRCLSLLFISNFMNQFLDSIIETKCDPISWILDTGKELERACEFAVALKFYFAGKMFFARWKHHISRPCEAPALAPASETATPSSVLMQLQQSHALSFCGEGLPHPPPPAPRETLPRWKQHKKDFERLYEDLLPMTNAEVMCHNHHQSISQFTTIHVAFSYSTALSKQAYASARESVHYQNVVLKRGTMSK